MPSEKQELKDYKTLYLERFFRIEELQEFQDLFSEVHQVASIITYPDGVPVTKASNFSNLCLNVIRESKLGCELCKKSDAFIGKQNPDGPTIRTCLSAGLFDAGVSINLGEKHIANWLIGQVRSEIVDEKKVFRFADQIKVDRLEFLESYKAVPVMELSKFKKIANLLYAFVDQISIKATKTFELEKEKELNKKREKYFQLLIQNSTDIISILDEEHRIKFESDSFQKVLGYPNRELYDTDGFGIMHPDDRIENANILEEILDKPNGVKKFKARFLHKEGHWLHFEGAVCNLLHIPEVNGYLANYRDITEQVKSQNKVKLVNNELQKISDNLPDIIWKAEVTSSGAFENEYVSEIAEELLDLPKGTINNSFEKYFSYLDSDYLEEVNNTIEQSIKNPGKVYRSKYKIFNSKQQALWFESYGRAYVVNQQVQIYGITKDVTEQTNQESELIRSEERFRQLIEHLPVGMAMYKSVKKGTDFEFIDFNKSAELITNSRKEDIVGSTLLEKFSNMSNSPLYHALCKVNTTGEEIVIPAFYYKDNQREGWRENVIYRLPAGEIVTLFRDVTAQIQYEDELKKAKEKAIESDRLKSAFLANMSHEIRTPMNGILGFINLLQRPGLKDKDREKYTKTVNKSGERLLNTINDIIEFSKIEAGDVPTHYSEVDICEFLEHYINFFSVEVQAKGIKMSLLIQDKLKGEVVRTDRNLLDSILTNLIKNAIKFTDNGEILIGCVLENQQLKIYVKDSGRGIELEKTNLIFDRFIQADTDLNRDYEGSGLGLAICKAYVEKLGGKIWVDSIYETGSTFYFTMDYNSIGLKRIKNIPFVEEEVQSSAMLNSNKPIVLVAEDDDTSFSFLKLILEEQNIEVLRAKNGIEAVKIHQKYSGIDLILMDLKMPEMDGLEATKKIREMDIEIPIIAQTAFALSGDDEKARQAGCNDYFTKPIDIDQFEKVLYKYIQIS